MKRLLYFIFATSIFYCNSQAQVKLNTMPDSISVNPALYELPGFISINSDGVKRIQSVNNTISLDLKNEYVYVNNNQNIYKFKYESIAGVNINGAPVDITELFTNKNKERIKNEFRKRLYQQLDLTEIIFFYSRKVRYAVSAEGNISIDKEKSKKAKICCVGLGYVVVLTEDGDSDILYDGDFNSLVIGEKKIASCRMLYDLFFQQFQDNLTSSISKWENLVLKYSVDSLLSNFGPPYSITEISNERKLITWKWEVGVYDVNITTRSSTFSAGFNIVQPNISRGIYSTIVNKSPILGYRNSYRIFDVGAVSLGPSSVVSTTSTNIQDGSVVKKDYSPYISVVQNNKGENIFVFHERMFSDPDYGKPFKFVNY